MNLRAHEASRAAAPASVRLRGGIGLPLLSAFRFPALQS